MKRTFLVEIETGDTDFVALSEDITEALLHRGINVINVKHWRSPGEPPPGAPLGLPIPPPSPL